MYFHPIWIKFKTGDVHENFESNYEFVKIVTLQAILQLGT